MTISETRSDEKEADVQCHRVTHNVMRKRDHVSPGVLCGSHTFICMKFKTVKLMCKHHQWEGSGVEVGFDGPVARLSLVLYLSL